MAETIAILILVSRWVTLFLFLVTYDGYTTFCLQDKTMGGGEFVL